MVGVPTTSEYAFLTPAALGPAAYREVCRTLDVAPTPGGYGALVCCDERGRRLTLLTADVDYLRAVVEFAHLAHELDPGLARGIPVSADKFVLRWPGDLAALLDRCGLAA